MSFGKFFRAKTFLALFVSVENREAFQNNIYYVPAGCTHACATQWHLSFITLSKTKKLVDLPYDLLCHNFFCPILARLLCCSQLMSGFFACFLVRDLCRSRSHNHWRRPSLGKCWDPRGPMIWGNFLFLDQIAPSWRHISALIYARVVGSRLDVVKLRDEMVRVARFSCRFFTAKAGNKAEKKNQGPSMYYYTLI